MAGFDPKAYLAEDDSPAPSEVFDPKAYLAEDVAEPGYLDRAASAVKNGLANFGGLIVHGGAPSASAQGSDVARAQMQGWVDQHRGDTLTQKIGGSQSDSPMNGNPLLSNLGPSNPVGAALAATRLGRTAAAGVVGGVQGATKQPAGDETRLGNAAWDATKMAALQGGAEILFGGAQATGNLPNTMKGKAEERAFKSAGAMLKDYRKAAGQDRVNDLGRYMIDNGLTKAGMTYGDVAKGAEALVEKHGEAIGGILKDLDTAGAAAPTHVDLASQIEQQAAPLKDLNTARPTYSALQDVAGDIRNMGKDSTGTFSGAQKVKAFISDQIEKVGGWTTQNPSEKNLALRDAYHMVNGAIEDAAGKAAQSVGNEGLLKNYLAQKSGYRNALELSKIAKDQTLRQNANRFLSPSDYFSGGMGAMVGAMSGDSMEERAKHAAMGLGAGLINKAARTYGTPLVSSGLDAGGSILARSGIPAVSRAMAPALGVARQVAPVIGSAAMGSGQTTSPGAAPAPAQQLADRAPAKGPDAWAQSGLGKLGIEDPALSARLLADPKAKELLIRASDLTPGSKAMKSIMDQIKARYSK